MQKVKTHDFNKIGSAKTYSDTYGKYLKFFENANKGDIAINVPKCWVPLLTYLGCKVQSSQMYFDVDKLF
jgi:hypothetical protein